MDSPSFQETRLWLGTLAEQAGSDPHPEPRTRLRNAYLGFRSRVATLVGEIGRDLPDLTVHDITHLDALWETASLVTGESVTLTACEAFVLGGAILLHDAGMSLVAYPGRLDELSRSKEWSDAVAARLRSHLGRAATSAELAHPPAELKAEVIKELLRSLHANQAERLAHAEWKDKEGSSYFLIDQPELRLAFGHIIGRIAHSHWWSVNELRSRFKEKLGPPAWCPGTWTVDPLKLACLLRVADASHIDSTRAPAFLKALRNPRGDSDSHWQFQSRLTKARVENKRLVYTSSIPFGLPHANAWWLCVDTLQIIDRELRQVNSLLVDTHRPPFEAQGVAGVDDPSRLTDLIPAEGWVPVDARVRVTDIPSLVERLGGEQLYGKRQTVPLRELIQNAADAIRARRLLDGRPESWGTITVRLGQDARGPWVEVEDTGVGMSQQVLTGALLDFGKTFWYSEEMRRELPGLAARGFNPIGRYGIGFFSVFMWGQHVQVRTRRYDEALRDTRVLEFSRGLSGRPILRPAAEEERLRDGGTCVRVWMNTAPEATGGLLKSGRNLDFSLAEVCQWICPGLDADLYTEDSEGERRLTVGASDWQTMDGQALLARIYGYGSKAMAMARNVAHLLRPVHDSSGRLVGRACLIPDLIWEAYSGGPKRVDGDGIITVGGLYASDMDHIAGIFEGAPLTAARDMALPLIDRVGLSKWASEQASLLSDTDMPREALVQAATVVRMFGGEMGRLPVAWGHRGWVSAPDIIKKFKNLNEVVLVDYDNVRLPGPVEKLKGLRPEVLFTTMSHMGTVYGPHVWPLSPPWPGEPNDERHRRIKMSTLMGATIEALAKAWSVTTDALLEDSRFLNGAQAWEERLIGSFKGKPVSHGAWVFRNSRAKRAPPSSS